MIAGIIRWSLDNRLLVLMLALLLTAWGILSVRQTPLDAIPDLSDVQVIVKTSYPGQAPQVVENQVTYPLATAMLSVPGAVTVRGYSFFSDSFVYVLFEDGTDLYWARARVLEYLNQVAADLPAAARPTLGPDATGVGWVYQYALVDRSGRHDLGDLRALQDWFIRYELQTVPGVAEVAAVGGMQRQYQVVADPIALQAQGLTLADLRQAIERGNQETGARVLEMAEAEYMLRATGYIASVEDLRAVPLKMGKDGAFVAIGDVATVRLGPDLRRGIGELNGEGEAVGGIVIMRYGGNPLTTIRGVKARLESLAGNLPPGVEIVETYNRAGLIERAIAALGSVLLEEFIIVALVCALFLFHPRSSLVVVLSLPLGILMAFILMRLQGINANIMSLGGIAIAIGAMVDATVVMLENVHKHLEREPEARHDPARRWRIVGNAAVEVGPALFFSLLIIALSFTPIFAPEGQEGRMFSPLAYTKTYAMAAAALLAITLVPVLIGLLARGRLRPAASNPVTRLLVRLYRPALQAALRTPVFTLALALLVTASTWIPLSRLGSEFMPELDEGDLLYMPSAFPAASAGKMAQLLGQTNRLIMQTPEVETAYAKAGRADSATDPAPLTMIETTIQLKPRDEWREGITLEDIRRELDGRVQIPSLTNTWLMPIKNRLDMLATGIKTPVGVKIAGDDLDGINRIARDVEKALKAVPGTASAYAERVTGGRYITIDVDRDRAARHGLNIADVHDVIASGIGGMQVGTVVSGRERYSINLRYPRELRDSLSQLSQLPVITADGAYLPLEELATLSVTRGPGVIRTENARLNGWVYVDVPPGDIAGYVEVARRAVADNVELPPGYTLHWSGQFEHLQRATERLALVVPAVIAIIALLLFITFQRVAPVFIVLGTLPLGLAGGYWLLYALGYSQSIATAVGLVALAGVAVEIGILMVLYLEQSMQRMHREIDAATRQDLRSAVIDGALARVRPIAMTVSSTIAGLMPIMLGSGTGAEVTRRIAAPMIGGMLSVTLLTLLVIPVIYYLCQSRVLRRDPAGDR
ncbi:MAG: CusA/CzcA family heavy metal efflux RND transporter [Chromatocurvus sp.]